MFYCERCGSSFNATISSSAGNCPRCKLRTGEDVPLYFRLFEPSALQVAGLRPRQRPANSRPEEMSPSAS